MIYINRLRLFFLLFFVMFLTPFDLVSRADAQETANSPMVSQNFKLTVISALMDAKVLDFGTFTEFLKQVEGPQYDYENDGYDRSEKAYRFFAELPLTKQQLGKVEELYFDGGIEIYPFVYPFWGGETDEFDIHSLADLKHLPNLRVFEINAMLTDNDLSSMRSLSKLEEVGLGLVLNSWQNMDVLLEFPSLKKLTIFDTNITNLQQRQVLEQLRSRGVSVSVY